MIEFLESEHIYTFQGKTLKGVTKAVAFLLGKKIPIPEKQNKLFQLSTLYGTDVHKEVENYFNHNAPLYTEAGKWIVQALDTFCKERNFVANAQSEVIVTDYVSTASKVDIVMQSADGVYLFDVKTTSYIDRKYCSLQLSVYKKLYESCYNQKVLGLFVLGTKSKRIYKILPCTDAMVQAVLEYNKL